MAPIIVIHTPIAPIIMDHSAVFARMGLPEMVHFVKIMMNVRQMKAIVMKTPAASILLDPSAVHARMDLPEMVHFVKT